MRYTAAAVHQERRRLHSWKDIAAHIGRDVRTAQRWEAEGLPVHRLPHEKLSSVFAYSDEIDGWLTARSVGPQASLEQTGRAPRADDALPLIAPTPASAVPRRARRLFATAALVIAALGISPGARLSSTKGDAHVQGVRTASDLLRGGQFASAEDILRRVVDEYADPLADVYLAWALRSEEKPASEYQRWADRAERHLTRATPPAEEYFVRGSRAHLYGDSEAAIKWYLAGVATSRADYWTVNNLVSLLSDRGWNSRVVDLLPKLVELGHDKSEAATFLFQYGDFQQSMKYRDEALTNSEVNPYDRCWLRMLPAQIAWVKGDSAAAARIARETIARLDVWSFERDETRRRAASILLLAGAGSEALEMLRSTATGAIPEADRAMVLGAMGSNERTRVSVPHPVWDAPQAVDLVAAAAGADDPGAVLRTALADAQSPAGHELLQAEALRFEKHYTEAIEHYQRVIALGPTVHDETNPEYIGNLQITVPVLNGGGGTTLVLEAYLGAADSYAQSGRKADAVRLLEKLSACRTFALVGHLPGVTTWLRGQALLTQLRAAERPSPSSRVAIPMGALTLP